MQRDEAYLLDMLLAAREARDFVASFDLEEFRANRMAQLAVVKAIEIVGEAASRVSDTFADGHPDIPWRAIVGMRNRLVRLCRHRSRSRLGDGQQQHTRTHNPP